MSAQVAEHDLPDELLRDLDAVGELGLVVGEAGGEPVGIGLVGEPALDHLDAQLRVARRGDLDGEAEPVEQLRPQLALLGVHRADEHELGGVLDRDAVALDRRQSHRGGVEQQVDEVVVQQVDLVDVEDAAVRAGQQAGLVRGDALAERLLQVQGAEHAVLGGADRQLDEADRPALGRRVGGEGAVGGERVRLARIGGEPVAGDHLDRRQHGGEAADHRRLGRALLAAHEHAADGGRDGGEGEGERHVVGSDDGAEGVVMWHVGLPP